MTYISRRNFLGSAAACAVSTSLPILPLPPLGLGVAARSDLLAPYHCGIYNGALFREVADLRRWIAEDHLSASLMLEALPSGRELAGMLQRTFAEAPYGR